MTKIKNCAACASGFARKGIPPTKVRTISKYKMICVKGIKIRLESGERSETPPNAVHVIGSVKNTAESVIQIKEMINMRIFRNVRGMSRPNISEMIGAVARIPKVARKDIHIPTSYTEAGLTNMIRKMATNSDVIESFRSPIVSAI